jgi:hypothetical protein
MYKVAKMLPEMVVMSTNSPLPLLVGRDNLKTPRKTSINRKSSSSVDSLPTRFLGRLFNNVAALGPKRKGSVCRQIFLLLNVIKYEVLF